MGSRRLHDAHVRKALENMVEQTKAQLSASSNLLETQQQQWDDGMLVNDALRYDNGLTKAIERRRHADYLQDQMAERKAQAERERLQKHAECAGYWGPENKDRQGGAVQKEISCHLIKQMEVDQQRKTHSRNQRLRQ